jgi:hypothetical protein
MGAEHSLGMYLHLVQDSFSHDGFNPLIGHIFAGTTPDKTYTDPDKADSMARSTYGALLEAGVQIGTEAGPVPLAQIMPYVQAFNRATTKKEKNCNFDSLGNTSISTGRVIRTTVISNLNHLTIQASVRQSIATAKRKENVDEFPTKSS